MRLFHQLVFDDFSMGSGAVVTAAWFEELLASADSLAIMVVAEAASAAVNLDVVLQHSSDGRSWLNKSTLTTLSLSTTAVTTGAAGDDGSAPTLRRARIRLAPSASTNVRLRVWATGRTLHAPGGAPSAMPRDGDPGCSCQRPPPRTAPPTALTPSALAPGAWSSWGRGSAARWPTPPTALTKAAQGRR